LVGLSAISLAFVLTRVNCWSASSSQLYGIDLILPARTSAKASPKLLLAKFKISLRIADTLLFIASLYTFAVACTVVNPTSSVSFIGTGSGAVFLRLFALTYEASVFAKYCS